MERKKKQIENTKQKTKKKQIENTKQKKKVSIFGNRTWDNRMVVYYIHHCIIHASTLGRVVKLYTQSNFSITMDTIKVF